MEELAPQNDQTSDAAHDRGEVGDMNIFQVRILAALKGGALRRSELFRKLGSPKAAEMDAACETLIRGGRLTKEGRPRTGKTGPVPVFYEITGKGLTGLEKYATGDGSYEVIEKLPSTRH